VFWIAYEIEHAFQLFLRKYLYTVKEKNDW